MGMTIHFVNKTTKMNINIIQKNNNNRNFYMKHSYIKKSRANLKSYADPFDTDEFESFSPEVINVLRTAKKYASTRSNKAITGPYIVLSILTTEPNSLGYRILDAFATRTEILKQRLLEVEDEPSDTKGFVKKITRVFGNRLLDSEASRIIDLAKEIAHKHSWPRVEVIHLLLAIYKYKDSFAHKCILK